MPHSAFTSDQVTEEGTYVTTTELHKSGHAETLRLTSSRDKVRVVRSQDASKSTSGLAFPKLQPTQYHACLFVIAGEPFDFIRHGANSCQHRKGDTSSLRDDIAFEPWKIGLEAFPPWRPLPIDYLTAKADNKASQHALIGLGENLSQIKQTLGLVSSLWLSAVKLIHHLLRLQVGKSFEEISKLWLMYRYGILPLKGDIETALKGLPFGSSDIILAEGTATMTKDVMDGSTFSPPAGWPMFSVLGSRTHGCTSRYALRVTNPTLAAMYQLGLDPIGLAWELIPFSFVVDWFINIGQLLTSLTGQYMGMSFLFGARTHFLKCKYRAQWIDLTNGSGLPKTELGHGRSFQRILLTHLPIPPVVLGGGFNFTHLLDGLALLISGGHKR